MESLLDKLSRNQIRIWRFIIIAVCVSVAASFVLVNNLPDIGDSDPQAYPQADSPLLMAIFKIIWYPAFAVDFICYETGIGINQNFQYIVPGLIWAFLVELLFVAKKRLWRKKPQDK
jgi:hypothetical protein